MAIYPCDVKSHRYPGAQQTVYAALVEGNDSWRRKMRLCPLHFELTVQLLESNAHNAQMAFDDPETASCMVCHRRVVAGNVQFFATVYATRTERADWWSAVCEDCAATVREDWDLPATMP